MKVGIDLSSTNTGLVILSDDNKLIFNGNFQLWDVDYKERFHKVADFVKTIDYKLPQNIEKLPVEIGIELADFKNADITNRFNSLAGMIMYSCFYRLSVSWLGEERILKIKLFNSNEWQRLLKEHYKGMYNAYKDEDKVFLEFYHSLTKDTIKIKEIFDSTRKILKAMSRDFTMWNCVEYQGTWTEDECDAYCIAYFLEKLRDRTQMHQEVKAKKVQAKKSKLAEKNEQIKKWRKENKLRQRQTKYLNILASGKKLTKAQDRALNNAIKELKEIK